ncbi:MAG TPA: PSD1 and planctomycete cytochrome C domain-containing protein [Pirellulaceae bacterium]|nr:PSD1 and planctomycete cytochrome C domain-containing protein [Pirellulaceae bacterium]
MVFRIGSVLRCAAASRSMALGLLLLALPGSAAAQTADTSRTISFNRDIRPILSDKCFACHGFDAKTREADLRLDVPEGAYDPSRGSAAVVPGDPAASELWIRINETDPDLRMPPATSHKELKGEELATIRAWIEQGAKYERHWSFEPIVRHPLPNLGADELSPIDTWLLARLKGLGLGFSPEADRETLLRRVAFALTGLPPTLEERRLYLEDQEPGAYERMVDRYLESPAYGEEMARHWLDVARYADTHGMHLDNERQTWAYRDWVVGAFNRNLSFDRFTIEQLAGDLLPEPTQDQLIATGFNRCNVTTSEGGSIDDELIYRYAVDRTSTTIQAWMGLTGGCAVCHDHKFDPLSTREFYSMYAFFHSAADPAMDGNALLTPPILKIESPEMKQRVAELEARLAEVDRRIAEIALGVSYVDPATLDPRPAAETTEAIWFDDAFPEGNLVASPGHPPTFVDDAGGAAVFSGSKALRRQDAGLAQDVWSEAKVPLSLPAGGVLFAYVRIDPNDPPKTLMLQFHRDGWQHRAVWGDYDAIPWGAAGTTEKVHLGELPAAGEWVRLEVPLATVGLAPGERLTGFALTQFGGTVWWDKVGVTGSFDPASDPTRSYLAWRPTQTQSPVPAELLTGGEVADDSEDAALRRRYLSEVCVTTKEAFAEPVAERQRLSDERKQAIESAPGTFVFRDLAAPRSSFVMMRGAYDKPGEGVEPATPAILPPLVKANPEGRATRLDLARWLVADEHPLTARVAVNRFWQQFFGTGLVKTSYDFGSQGEAPSHPELLDMLALDFRESGWDIKRLVRTLLLTRAFRQSSYVTPQLLTIDPTNRLLARGPRYRLDAEQIRDNALALSGLLVRKMGGVGTKPYQPDNIWEPVGFAGSNTRFYQRDSGEALYRRSIYVFLKRTAPPPFMSNFDAPNREQSCSLRERSNTPLQALQLMNDVQHVEAAKLLGQRAMREGGTETDERIRWLFLTVLAREAEADELAIVRQQFDGHLERYRSDLDAAKRLMTQGEMPADAELDAAESAAWTLVANLMLNLDETLTRN